MVYAPTCYRSSQNRLQNYNISLKYNLFDDVIFLLLPHITPCLIKINLQAA